MAEFRRVVKIFLASPGDLTLERQTVKAVAEEINITFATLFGYQVELVGWEDTVSVYGRPQETINRDLAGCELFIGLMWKHWGTQPDTSGLFSSGFEEEFNISSRRREMTGSPEMSMFFKDVDSDFLRDPGDGLKKVLGFRDDLIRQKKLLFENFSTLSEFEKKIRRCIIKYLTNLREKDVGSEPEQSQPAESEKATIEIGERIVPSPLSAEGLSFLRSFAQRTERASVGYPLKANEIARFRLLATLVSSHANDKLFLGVHDANLMYANEKEFTLGNTEVLGLLNAGLHHYTSEVVPIWKWYSRWEMESGQLLHVFTLGSETPERASNTLRIMRSINYVIPPHPHFDRSIFIKDWLDPETAGIVRSEALLYLAYCGREEDLIYLNDEFARNDTQTVNAAAEAIIRLKLRNGRQQAIRALYDLKPLTIDTILIDDIFGDGRGLDDATLLEGVFNRNIDVRKVCISILAERSALPVEIAENLLKDSDSSIRYASFRALIKKGQIFQIDAARKIIVGENVGLRNSLLALANHDGDVNWEQYYLSVLGSLSIETLNRLHLDSIFFDLGAEFALVERKFKNSRDRLKESVRQRFKAEFEERGGALNDAVFMEKIRPLEELTRRTWARQALNLISNKSDKSDLVFMRETLRDGFVTISTSDLKFLKKYGEWEDVRLILEMSSVVPAFYAMHSLSGANPERAAIAVEAILYLGQGRLSDVFENARDTKLLAALVAKCSDVSFRMLTDESVLQLLKSGNEAVRKVGALKCVKTFSQLRLEKLNNAIVSETGVYFYNVVHWLDFGISMKRATTLPVVSKLLKEVRS